VSVLSCNVNIGFRTKEIKGYIFKSLLIFREKEMKKDLHDFLNRFHLHSSFQFSFHFLSYTVRVKLTINIGKENTIYIFKLFKIFSAVYGKNSFAVLKFN